MPEGMVSNDNERAGASRFDYSALAELFMVSARGTRGRATGYRRFHSAAEAIRFAIEEVPEQLLIGVIMEVQEERFDHNRIRELYDSRHYPLSRP